MSGNARSLVAQSVARARADWVLRWILEKLKDTGDSGAQARASDKAWKLLELMVEVLPVSRCAPHLRDADFLNILEKALEENFGVDGTIQPETSRREKHPRDDSSEPAQGNFKPSRKRKRGSVDNTPVKKAATESCGSVALFHVIRTTVQSIRDKGYAEGTGEERVQSEHMKMVLRTESEQAARVLKNWLTTVQRIHTTSKDTPGCFDHMKLSLVVDIWDLRAIDTKDEHGASVEQFSTECLIPALLLSQTIHRSMTNVSVGADLGVLTDTSLALDRLIAKHVLVPSRSAFFIASSETTTKESKSVAKKAELLANSLGPLNAKILQAAQIQDTGVEIPTYFVPLFAAVPYLLDLVIRSSPARTPKSRTAEKPWIQAALVTLAQCVGCSLNPPEFAAPQASISAFEQCLTMLASHNVSIDAHILRDLFWFHSGFTYPLNQVRVVNWPLVAALVEIDPSIFLVDPKATSSSTDERPSDLAAFLFERISSAKFEMHVQTDDDAMDIDGDDTVSTTAGSSSKSFSIKEVVKRIIVPIIHAFARNRQLLGFIDRWDDELRRPALVNSDPLQKLHSRIWGDRDLVMALSDVFEQSLTLTQISALFQKHAKQLEKHSKKHPNKAIGSAVIVQAILHSIKSEETIEALRPTMLSVWKTYEAWTQQSGSSQHPTLEVAWTSLSLLLGHLWPIYFHGSAALQKEFVRPLLERASKDVNSARKEEPNHQLHPSYRTAAVVFVFVACDYFSTLPDVAELIEKRLQKTLKAISSGHLETNELNTTLELFCTEYAQLLESVDVDTAQEILTQLMETLSKLDEPLRNPLINTLSASIFNPGKAGIETAFVSVLLENLDHATENLCGSSISALLQLSPLSLSREQREAALDKLLGQLILSSKNAAPLLNIMVHLMQVPNASAKVSSDGNALFNIAQALHEAETEEPPSVQLLQSLVQSTLGHLIPNKDQTQNKIFFEQYGKKVESSLKKSKTCSPAKLAVLTGTLLAAPEWDALVPFSQYVDFLGKALDKWSTSQDSVLEAYNNIPISILRKNNLLDKVRTSLREWVSTKSSLDVSQQVKIDSVPTKVWPSVFVAIAKYQQWPSREWLLRLASQLLHSGVSERPILQGVRDALTSLESNSEKVDLITFCILLANEVEPKVAYQLLHATISALDDKQEANAELKVRQMAILPQVCTLLSKVRDDAAFNILVDTIDTILLHKPNMTSQHNIECLLTVLLKLSTRSSPRLSPSHAPAIYARICETTRLLLLLNHSRSRLGGRFHLLLPLLQSLLLCLFIPNLNRGAALPPWLDSPSASSPIRLTPANAAQYAHLLSTLCSPTQSSVQKTRSATTLNDPIRAAREYASHHVYPLLSSFCLFTLYGRLDADVRNKLMPGIWEVVSVGQMHKEGIDAMFAGLGKSERDVWRGVWSEWVRIYGRQEKKPKREREK